MQDVFFHWIYFNTDNTMLAVFKTLSTRQLFSLLRPQSYSSAAIYTYNKHHSHNPCMFWCTRYLAVDGVMKCKPTVCIVRDLQTTFYSPKLEGSIWANSLFIYYIISNFMGQCHTNLNLYYVFCVAPYHANTRIVKNCPKAV